MLSIIFNRGSKDIENTNYVFSPDTWFKYNYEEEWFEDELVKEMEEPLRELMTAFSDISGSYTYADNQYAEAKEYHTII